MKLDLKKIILFCVGMFISTQFIYSQNQTLTKAQKAEFQKIEASQILIQANLEKNRGNLEAASQLYYQVLSFNSESSLANYELSVILLQQNKNSQAVSFAKKAVKLQKNNTTYRIHLAHVYAKMEKHAKGIAQLQIASQLEPKNMKIPYLLVIAFVNNKKYDKSIETLDFIESCTGISQELLEYRYMTYVYANDTLQAQKQLQLLENKYRNSAILKLANKQKELSLKSYKTLSLNEAYAMLQAEKITDSELFMRILDLEQENNAIDSLVIISKQARELHPLQSEFYVYEAYAHIKKSNYSLAISVLLDAIEYSYIFKSEFDIYLYLGLGHSLLNKIDSSEYYMQKARQIDSLQCKYLQTDLFLQVLQKKSVDLQNPLCLENAIGNISFTVFSALDLYNKKEYSKALGLMNNATVQYFGVFEYELFGDILYKNNQIDKAIEYWKKANEIGGIIDIQRKIVILKNF